MGQMRVLIPTGSRAEAVVAPATRASLLAGGTFGVIHTTKPNAAPLLHALSRLLEERHGLRQTLWFDKTFGAGRPSPQAWIASLRDVDAVLIASAD